MDKLNLEVDKYSISELKDIFDIIELNDISQIKNKLDSMIVTVNNDTKISIEHRGNIIQFLKKAYNKICSGSQDDNSNFFSSATTNMISNAPENHPLIQSANKIGGQTAKIFEGRGGDNFPAGYLNPINIRTTKQMINVDSIFRDNYNSTNSSQFSIDMPQTIKGVVEMHLASLQIPLTIYSINEYSNYFKINYKNKCILIEIKKGNYLSIFSGSTFNTDFNNSDIIKNIQKVIEAIDETFNLKIDIDPLTGLVYFEYTPPKGESVDNYPSFEFIDENSENIIGQLGWLLGFKKNNYYFLEETIGNGYPVRIYAEAPITIEQPKYLYFCVNDFTNASSNQYVVPLSESILSPYILYKIDYQSLVQNSGLFNYGIVEEPHYAMREYFGPVDIKKLQFSILDEFGRVVNFNNSDWNAQLAFTRMYE